MSSRLTIISKPTYLNALSVGQLDPTGLSDSWQGAQAAINKAGSSGIRIVYFPTGFYSLSLALTLTASDVSIIGDGADKTIFIAAPNTTYNSGFINSYGYWSFVENHLMDIGVDLNGSNGAVMGNQSSAIYMASRSRMERCWIGNKAGTVNGSNAGSTTIMCTGHDVTFRDCYFYQDRWWQTYTTGAITPSGAAQNIPINDTTNFAYVSGSVGNSTVIIDPSVNAMVGDSSGVASGTVWITPITARDAPRIGSGNSTGMKGIVPGMKLTIDTSASGVQETNVTVLAVSPTQFQVSLAHAHSQYAPITYQGNTECMQIVGAVGAGTINVIPQLTHASGVAVIGITPTFDAIAATGQTNGYRIVQGVTVDNCRFEDLGEDAVGIAAGRQFKFLNNYVNRCVSGMAWTISSDGQIVNNYIDLSYGGICPWNFFGSPVTYNWIYSGLFATAGTAPAGTPSYTDYKHLIVCENTVIGGAYSLMMSGSNSIYYRQSVVENNTFDSPSMMHIYAEGVRGLNIGNNAYRNANKAQQASILGLPIASIMLYSGGATTRVDGVTIKGGTVTDDTGNTNRTQTGVTAYGADVTNVLVEGMNVITTNGDGSEGVGGNGDVMYKGGSAVVTFRNNPGYNPAYNVATPAFPSNGTWVQNTTGVDVKVYLTLAGVTQTHIYLNRTNSTTGAKDLTATPPAEFDLPSGAWFMMNYSAGTPSWVWVGN